VFVDEEAILIESGFSNLFMRSDAPLIYGALRYLIGLLEVLVCEAFVGFSDCLMRDSVNFGGKAFFSDIFCIFSSSEVKFSSLQTNLARLAKVLMTLRF